MAKEVDLDLLRQITADSIQVYEAIGRAQTFTAEGKHAVIMAENLLRQTGLVYLLKGEDPDGGASADSSHAPEKMVSAYVQIQQSYNDLKDALYRLAKNYLEAKQWDNARAVMQALFKIDPQYRDTAILLQKIILSHAEILFEQGKWEEGLASLEQGLPDRGKRLAYFLSFLAEHDVQQDDGLRALQREEPGISSLPSFGLALSDATRVREQGTDYYKEHWRGYLQQSLSQLQSEIASSSHRKK